MSISHEPFTGLEKVVSVPAAEDRTPIFLSRRIQRLIGEVLVHLAAIDGHRYDDLSPMPHPDGGYHGWLAEAVFTFHGAKHRFPETFGEDILADQEAMWDTFRHGQREVLEPEGLWTTAMEAMDSLTFWEEFIPPEPDSDPGEACAKRPPLAETPQGRFQRRWEERPGELFSLQVSVLYVAPGEADNQTGEAEVQIVAGLNGDYVTYHKDILIKSIKRTLTERELNGDPRRLLTAFAEVVEFFDTLK